MPIDFRGPMERCIISGIATCKCVTLDLELEAT